MNTNTMPAEVQMAIGRIFSLMSRPEQPGDVEQYEKARRVVLAFADDEGRSSEPSYQFNYARDRLCGAQGD